VRFFDREDEMDRLDRLVARSGVGLAVLYGRRRVGKTRLLVEWCRKHRGVYTVSDQSSADVQRRYLAAAVAERLPGFADVEYGDWSALFARLAKEARSARWRGPIVLDELPYLIVSSPELPSVLQRWIDHEAAEAGLKVAVAGSSQRMMQGLVLSSAEPLFGRAHETFEVRPLPPRCLAEALSARNPISLVEAYAAWGGIPRYWELAAAAPGHIEKRIDRLVLDPLGPLHREPDRLLIEEIPPAAEVRPILDAIGMGVHRLSEIASRAGFRSTSLSKPLERLVGMGLVRREIPFGESEKTGKRSLYRIADPFTRLWFTVVAPHRALLATAGAVDRVHLLRRSWARHVASVWEDLCRDHAGRLLGDSARDERRKWGVARRWWHKDAPEWDVVAEDAAGKSLLLGEAKWKGRPFGPRDLARAARDVADKPPPSLPGRFAGHRHVRVLFVPQIAGRGVRTIGHVRVATGDGLLL
jgi:hypothetical protein